MADLPNYFLAHRKATARGPIVRCEDCGFVFTSPRLSDADYDAIYSNIATPHEGVADFDAAKAARFQRLARIVRQECPNGSFVDFGCGDGTFLKEMNDPAGKGFEIGSPGSRTAGRSEILIDNWASVVGSTRMPLHSLDFVTAFDVLEHLPRIEQDVALIRSLLRTGGLFFASVPNIQSPVANLMGKRWNMLLLEHLWYFSPKTFSRFLAKFGFEQVSVRPLPFDAPLAHLINRLAQNAGIRSSIKPRGIGKAVLPLPAGLMLGIYRAV
jgi:SAM-dependent methyltransferase